ncbi:7-cyano-7-deazaguanine synthase [Bosea sp. OK403]|uniref:7-cyano-7-deazaguanine synthase n=1 Tax=Bosea sp. OK403 TaxID=1855286 RepID=UPI0008E62DAC|nr:7-cyano-7-deazaguanine synthase [Bosea sp. OK403]SFJ77292.1 7-cyano-7-deazaguanine synthase [Bosea sp. OK403]
MKAALLLSGGMDSIAIAYWKRPTIAVTVDYGQLPAPAEIRAAAAVCCELDIQHIVVRADLSALGSGDMAGRPAIEVAPLREWWPFRNQMLVTLAAMATLAHGVTHLMLGTLKTDGQHVDGQPGFIDRLDQLLKFQEGGLCLFAPAIELTAEELIRTSKVPGEIIGWAHSCHRSDFACGECGGCRKHYRTMEAIGLGAY